jgi:hypothetical protein
MKLCPRCKEKEKTLRGPYCAPCRRAWERKNRECPEVRAQQKAYRLQPHVAERYLELGRDWKRNHPLSRLLHDARRRAKDRGLLFDLTLADFTNPPEFCPILGLRLHYSGGKGQSSESASLDRKDPSKGYIRGNVWIISWRANDLKANGTLAEFQAIVRNWPR